MGIVVRPAAAQHKVNGNLHQSHTDCLVTQLQYGIILSFILPHSHNKELFLQTIYLGWTVAARWV